MAGHDDDRRSTRPPRVDRVDVDRVVSAPKEDSGDRRAAEADTKRKIEDRARRSVEDQERLVVLLKEKEKAWEAERALMRAELDQAAEDNVNLDQRIKRSSLVNTLVTSAIAGVTALASVGAWAYSRMQTAAEDRVMEEQRRIQVTKELQSADSAVKDVSRELEEHKDEQAVVNAEQAKVNTVQLLRGQRLETLMELMLVKQGGTRPPQKKPEQREAECEAGLLPADECD
jgi:PII-like signaling protein